MRSSTADVIEWIGASDATVALTGAGISTDSGIPDFRGPRGIWTRDPAAQRLFTIENYVADPRVRQLAWQERLRHPAWTAEPGRGHQALAELERGGRLQALLTQNIDGLHQAAGSSHDVLVELHGTLRQAMCLTCGLRTPMLDVLARVEAGDPDPACLSCGGIQKSATISFGQSLDPAVLQRAWDVAAEATLFLAIGTSLHVMPAAALCDVARDHGARLVIVNAEPTPYDAVADALLRAPIAEVLPILAGDGDGA